MTESRKLIGYSSGESFVHRLSGVSKLIFFLLVSASCMITYDTRLILVLAIGSTYLLAQSGIRFRDISFVIGIIMSFASLNIVMVYLFSPQYGTSIYGKSDVLLEGIGRYNLTSQELFYLFNLGIKYVSTVPLAILFLKTTHPSQFASSLNQIGVSYRIAYAISLTLRYIPDLQEEYHIIRLSQEARGLELSKKAKLIPRIKGNLEILIPLIFSSLSKIDTISTAMELRRFGKHQKRSWYTFQPLKKADILAVLLAFAILSLTFFLFWFNQGRFYNPWK